MGLVSRFEIGMQAGEDIQYHQAGLGGLRNEKIEKLTKNYDDITGSPGKRRRVASSSSSSSRKGVGGGEVRQEPGGTALTRSRPPGGTATTPWTWPPAPTALTGRVLGGDDRQPVPGGQGVPPSCLSAQGAPGTPPTCPAPTGGPPAPPAPPISGRTASVRLLAGLWEQGPLGEGGKAGGRSTRSSRGRSRASQTGSTTSSKTSTRASTGSEQSVHKGAVGSHHLRGQWRLPDHHRELEEGGAGRVHQGAVRPRHHLREPQGLPDDHHRDLTEGEGGRVVTEGPPECAHHH